MVYSISRISWQKVSAQALSFMTTKTVFSPASVPTMLDNLVEGLVQIMPEWEPLLRTNTGLAADLVERELLDTYQGRDGGGAG